MRRSIHSLGAWACSLGWTNPRSTTGNPRMDSKLAETGIEPPSRMNTAGWPNTASSARAAAWAIGWSIGVWLGRPLPRSWTVTVTPGGAISVTKSRNRSKMTAGSWAATSRQLTLAWAWAGMIVLAPAPWKPPQMPLTSRVGRVARRSSVV